MSIKFYKLRNIGLDFTLSSVATTHGTSKSHFSLPTFGSIRFSIHRVAAMISIQEALFLIREHFPDYGTEEKCLTRFESSETAEDIFADRDYPPFDRVMMDGIAVNFNVYQEGKREFKVLGICPAGEPPKKLLDFSGCYEVMTGAPLPEGSDLVIPYEHLNIKDGVATISLEVQRSHLENVHLKGSDVKAKDVVLSSDMFLDGPARGIAASVGAIKLKLKRKPRINIISTGDELVDIDEIPEPHQIRRSNAYALQASLNLFGHKDVDLSHLPDDRTAIEDHYLSVKNKYDMLIYSGGVSQGKFDYLPVTWKKLGIKEIFHGISQRPGRPLWFGVDLLSKTVVVGLPGNPVSSLVCLHRYFLEHREIYVELSEEIVFKKELTYFVPVKLEFTRTGTLKAHPLKIKNSGEFSALAGSDGFVELPREQTVFKKGESFLFHSWRPM